jgi:hypothetical protein
VRRNAFGRALNEDRATLNKKRTNTDSQENINTAQQEKRNEPTESQLQDDEVMDKYLEEENM